MTVWPLFSVVAAVLSEHEGNIIVASCKKLPPYEASIGEAQATLLAAHLAIPIGRPSHSTKGDSLLTFLAINKGHLYSIGRVPPLSPTSTNNCSYQISGLH